MVRVLGERELRKVCSQWVGASPRGRAQARGGLSVAPPSNASLGAPHAPSPAEPTARQSHPAMETLEPRRLQLLLPLLLLLCGKGTRGLAPGRPNTLWGHGDPPGFDFPHPRLAAPPARRAMLRRGEEGGLRRHPQTLLWGRVGGSSCPLSPEELKATDQGWEGRRGVSRRILPASSSQLRCPRCRCQRSGDDMEPAAAGPAPASLCGSELPVLGLSHAHHAQGVGERNPDPEELVPSTCSCPQEDSP